MRYFGDVYDAGLVYGGGWFSNERFDPELVRYDMHALKNDLNANAGARGWRVLEGNNPDGSGKWKDGVIQVRCENEQADYTERQLRAFVEAGVEAASYSCSPIQRGL